MEVRRIPTYGMASNCYVISDGRESAVIDPSAKLEYITAALADAGTKLKYILLTHGHFDQIRSQSFVRRPEPRCVSMRTMTKCSPIRIRTHTAFSTLERRMPKAPIYYFMTETG